MANKEFPFLPKMIATTFGCGYWPWGPGTMGAIFGLAVWMPLILISSPLTVAMITLGLIIIFTILGIWAAGISERYWGDDPSRVVMDETVGQWITMLPMASLAGGGYTAKVWICAAISLILFRFFDIVKPLGVRKMEAFGGGLGIMADDILAGIYGCAIMCALIYII